MLSIEEAVRMILDCVETTGTELVSLTEAFGRILAEEIRADADVPFTDNSAMDGYAVRAECVLGASAEKPAELEVIGEAPAGTVLDVEITPGTAVRIMTGAPIPRGADAVVMVEYTETNSGRAKIKTGARPGENIRRAGEDVLKGELLFSPGRRIGAADAGVIASAGRMKAAVGRRPVVGIISTGDEIVEPGEPSGPGRVRNSNSYSLYSLCLAAGAAPAYLGIIPDRRAEIETAFRDAARSCDVILTSGGVSAGDYDFVKAILEEIGDIKFWKVAMKPGKPIAFGRIGGALLFGLPGNPVSVMVGFEMFVRPALLKMMGASVLSRPRATARMEHELKEKPSRTKIMRGIASRDENGLSVRTTGGQGSGILKSMVLANCFIIMPEGLGSLGKGDAVEIIPLDNFPPG
ncbi:MAG: gephyrin-like molybdotransferase Glp [bacterium]